MPSWKDIEPHHNRMKTARAREEWLWRDLARFLRPDEQSLDAATTRDRDGLETFDSTPLYAIEDFIGGMFGNSTNPVERWFGFGLEDEDLAKYGPVKKYLWQRASINFARLAPARSPFYCECPPWIGDMAGFGTGWLGQEEWTGQARIVQRAYPIGEMFKEIDAAGETCRVHREFMLDGQQTKKWWGDRAPGMRDNENAKFVHAVYQNDNYRAGALGPRGMRWVSCYVSPDKQDFAWEKAFYELPYHELQWARRSGRAWSTGPGHNALADMRGLDEMQRSLIVAMQFEAEPMWLVADEDVMTAADVFPSAMVYKGLNAKAEPMVQPLARGENLHLPMTEREQLRTAIRTGFAFGLWQVLKNRPQMTATEFLGFKEEDLKLLAPHVMPIQRGLAGFVLRHDGILARSGAFDQLEPPRELVGQVIQPTFVSPFEKAQKAEAARGSLQWSNSLADLAVKTQDPAWLDPVNKDALSRKLHDAMVGDPDVINDERAIAAIRQGRAAAQQHQAQIEQAAQKASVVADVAHASQAMTLSQGRRAA